MTIPLQDIAEFLYAGVLDCMEQRNCITAMPVLAVTAPNGAPKHYRAAVAALNARQLDRWGSLWCRCC